MSFTKVVEIGRVNHPFKDPKTIGIHDIQRDWDADKRLREMVKEINDKLTIDCYIYSLKEGLDMVRIKFRPIGKIRRTIDGKPVTLFVPKYEYNGLKYSDGDIFGFSPIHKEPIKLSENDILISHLDDKGTKKF